MSEHVAACAYNHIENERIYYGVHRRNCVPYNVMKQMSHVTA
ncbi:Uncharacterised protein [Psychrobacter phenylpyruvicus]|uniref:Uncharacterized protein n=1 Tax=Psychrobacter phenylpyruvicus TaxID=29432 RepID=A0A379LPM3_9GAMM|nr:Uncharacterised protein [Psychrobacter phenylpyruvicus]